jgi:ATP-dependent DNA ligase
LLGLYDSKHLLHHVGFTSGLRAAEKAALTAKLEAIVTERSFTGNAPGGPSRWSTKRSTEWVALKPRFVVEVSYDHLSEGRFRHGTTILRWRPDKKAQTMYDGAAAVEINKDSPTNAPAYSIRKNCYAPS